MTAALCPCGCNRPARPGKMYAGPHLDCQRRHRKLTGWNVAHGRRLAPRATEARRARVRRLMVERAQREAAAKDLGPLTDVEATWWNVARLRGYDNGQKLGALHGRRAVVPSDDPVNVARGRHCGTVDAPRKHRAACAAAAARLGLAITRRLVRLWSAAYRVGYLLRYPLSFVKARDAALDDFARAAARAALLQAPGVPRYDLHS